MKYHLMFEQSGTFKRELIKLGYEAIDYDIQDEFGETDVVVDLFGEIEKAYDGGESIFDEVGIDDTIIAFFPCTRFEDQIQMHFRGTAVQYKRYSMQEKLRVGMRMHEELHALYTLISKLAIICLDRGIPLIIENPYSTTHYLVKYWAIPSKIIDNDRRIRGDYYKKPTQYWFIGCEPKQNMVLEAYSMNDVKTISDTHDKTERSMISSEYASRFIREFILGGDKNEI